MLRRISFLLVVVCMTAVLMSATSCIPHIHGNGKVVKEERSVSNFEAIDVSNGIDVQLSQDNFEKVVVECDENIQHILKTQVHGGTLKIYLEEGVLHARQLTVYVTVKQLRSVETSSGSSVKTTGKITAENLKVSSSSGSGLNMEVGCNHLTARSSSGSEQKISGTAQMLDADSSSGSGIKASDLVAEQVKASASSGASIRCQATKEIRAHASSGAGISVTGNPSVRDTDSSSGGSVHFK